MIGQQIPCNLFDVWGMELVTGGDCQARLIAALMFWPGCFQS